MNRRGAEEAEEERKGELGNFEKLLRRTRARSRCEGAGGIEELSRGGGKFNSVVNSPPVGIEDKGYVAVSCTVEAKAEMRTYPKLGLTI